MIYKNLPGKCQELEIQSVKFFTVLLIIYRAYISKAEFLPLYYLVDSKTKESHLTNFIVSFSMCSF